MKSIIILQVDFLRVELDQPKFKNRFNLYSWTTKSATPKKKRLYDTDSNLPMLQVLLYLSCPHYPSTQFIKPHFPPFQPLITSFITYLLFSYHSLFHYHYTPLFPSQTKQQNVQLQDQSRHRKHNHSHSYITCCQNQWKTCSSTNL